MKQPADLDTRTAIVLQQEVDRMAACAERVRLVVQAFALRKGLRPTLRTDPDFDFGA